MSIKINKKTGNGFHMTFKNGWTVSAQMDKTNYCNNRHEKVSPESCENAEIAAWDSYGNWYNFGNDTVKGYVEADDIAEFIAMIAKKR